MIESIINSVNTMWMLHTNPLEVKPGGGTMLKASVRRESAYQVLLKDPLRYNAQLPFVTTATFFDASVNTQPSYLRQIAVPFLISQGTNDGFMSDVGPKMLYTLSVTPVRCKYLQFFVGAKHNLLADAARSDELRTAWAAFMERALTNSFVSAADVLWGSNYSEVDTTHLDTATYGMPLLTNAQ